MTPLDKIKDRCTVDEVTGCWIWKGATSPSNGGKFRQPRVYSEDYTADPTGATKTVQTGGRAAWHAHTGKPIEPGHRVFKTICCTNGLCVNPKHLACGTTTTWGQTVAKRGDWKNVTARIRANRAHGRAVSRVTPEIMLAIQSSTETGRKLATEFDLSRTTVSRVRRGRLKSIVSVGNPFGGLMR